MTNEEWIKSLSAEELGKVLADICEWMFEVDFNGDYDKWTEWLRQERK